MRGAVLSTLLLVACQGRGAYDIGVPELTLDLTSPEYGSFVGEEWIHVEGDVPHAATRVYVEGHQIAVDADGHFAVDLPVEHPGYRNVDVEAVLVDQYLRERVPVFRGQDPLDTWPGGITGRLTPRALETLGEQLGAMIDDSGWLDGLDNAIPTIEGDQFSLIPTGVTRDPTVVKLLPAEDGIDLALSIQEIALNGEIRLGDFGGDLRFGFEEITLGARAVPMVDDQGYISLTVTESQVGLGDSIVEIDGADNIIFELIIDLLGGVINTAGEFLLDMVLDGFLDEIPLGGPFNFDTDLLGTPLSIRLSDVSGDLDGLALGLGVGLGEPVVDGPLEMPTPSSTRSADLILGLHEGLFQLLLQSELLDLLSQDIQLGGLFGEIIGVAIEALPGGHTIPANDGWCVNVEPGQARVARLQGGIEPLAILYMPDLRMNVGYTNGSTTCLPWLQASLAVEMGLEVTEGTKLGFQVEVPDGAVLAYGADGAWTEAEVVEGLGGFLDTVIGFAGGQLEFDLADMLGGGDLGGLGFGDMQMEIIGSSPILTEDGEHPEGLYGVQLQLWE